VHEQRGNKHVNVARQGFVKAVKKVVTKKLERYDVQRSQNSGAEINNQAQNNYLVGKTHDQYTSN
jgi:hypothetical protein